MADPVPTRTPKVVFTPEEIAIISQYLPQQPLNPDQPPLPAHPGIFQRGPMTQGPAGLSAALLAIQKAFPWLTQNTPTTRITEGFTKDSADRIQESNDAVWRQHSGRIFDSQDFPETNLLGLHNMNTHDITVRPNPPARAQTLVHELLHALGYPEAVTSEMSDRLDRLQRPK